jgi:hypothetical protein
LSVKSNAGGRLVGRTAGVALLGGYVLTLIELTFGVHRAHIDREARGHLSPVDGRHRGTQFLGPTFYLTARGPRQQHGKLGTADARQRGLSRGEVAQMLDNLAQHPLADRFAHTRPSAERFGAPGADAGRTRPQRARGRRAMDDRGHTGPALGHVDHHHGDTGCVLAEQRLVTLDGSASARGQRGVQ